MTSTTPASVLAPARRWSAAQRFAGAFGLVYLTVGTAGFTVTGTQPFAGHHHETLLIFAVNPLHNVVHVVLALAWLGGCAWHRTARAVNVALGVVLGLVTVLGFAGGMGLLGMAGLSDPDNFLHLATATLALYFGSVAAGSAATRPEHGEPAPGELFTDPKQEGARR
jgi:hypothetical protein